MFWSSWCSMACSMNSVSRQDFLTRYIVNVFETWYAMRKNSTGMKEQDVLEQLVLHGVLNEFGLTVGLLDEERILPLGKDLTIVGICSFRDVIPEIISCKDLPYFLSRIDISMHVQRNSTVCASLLP